MTTLTGKTAMTLAGTLTPPTFAETIGGAVAMSGLYLYVWTGTSAGAYWADPVGCLTGGDAWARQVVLTLLLNAATWLYSLRTIPTHGTSDSSIVDRLWSVAPVLTCWHWLLAMDRAAPGYPRVLIMTILCTIWGVRLTGNFIVKGGFSGGEPGRRPRETARPIGPVAMAERCTANRTTGFGGHPNPQHALSFPLR